MRHNIFGMNVYVVIYRLVVCRSSDLLDQHMCKHFPNGNSIETIILILVVLLLDTAVRLAFH